MKFKVEYFISGPYTIPYIATCKSYKSAIACMRKHISKYTSYNPDAFELVSKSKSRYVFEHKFDPSARVYSITKIK